MTFPEAWACVREMAKKDVLASEPFRIVISHPPIAGVIAVMSHQQLDPHDPYAPHPRTVQEMCYAILGTEWRDREDLKSPTQLVSKVQRGLRTAVYYRYYPDRPRRRRLPKEARPYAKRAKQAEQCELEPLDMAWAKKFKKSAERIRALRTAYSLACAKSLPGPWCIKRPDGVVVMVRRSRKPQSAEDDDAGCEFRDMERLVDAHDRCSE